MSPLRRAMGMWLATLANGPSMADWRVGLDVARTLVGHARFDELIAWLSRQPWEVVLREQTAALDACAVMLHADGIVHGDEWTLFERMVRCSGLPDDDAASYLAAAQVRPTLADLEDRLTHPVLRELLLGLAWKMALADGIIVAEEVAVFEDVTARLHIEPERARVIADLVRGL